MTILAGYAVPHPPLIVESVGRGEERAIQHTIDAYRSVAERICALRPQVIVISSPHAPLYRDGFHVTTDTVLEGSMEAFGAPSTKVRVTIDTGFADEIIERAHEEGIPTAPSSWRDHDMDHATFIPLYFIERAYRKSGVDPDFEVVRVGLSGLSPDVHRSFGRIIAQVAEDRDTRCVFVASGDLSHKLKEDGPYGFAPEGPELDGRLCAIFRSCALEGLFDLSEELCERGAECGVRSFQIMIGALEGSFDSQIEGPGLLSYEGPFGVGYAVAAFEMKETNDDLGDVSGSDHEVDRDPYVELAQDNIERFIRCGMPIDLTSELKAELPSEMTTERAGVFVSIHEQGDLRGCIGTIAPTTACIAEEIIQNGISAATRDPRFPPIEERELNALEINVDVLLEPEPVSSIKELDPKNYGVIVTKGFRRGLLLPDLEGVDTVEDQLAIAKRKAGIRVDDKNVEIERFKVIRHE